MKKHSGFRDAKTRHMRREKKEDMFPMPGDLPCEDTASVMRFYGIKPEFPREALLEAANADRLMSNPGKRLDLRDKFIFTCDPESARDYDDALSIERSASGRTILGVHIADVSHFVPEGGALDREAKRRSTSVYFADRVIPMLPHELSDGLCSLVPGEDRLAFSVFITFDSSGKMRKATFAKSVIRSSARYTYEQVMRVISNGRKGRSPGVGRKERDAILSIHELASKLRARRFADGALDIDIPETQILLDADGELSGVVSRPYDESHQMIEECMVAANSAVAQALWTDHVKILTRLHEPPDPEKLELLRADMASAGIETGDLTSRKAFSKLTNSIKGNPLQRMLSVMILRSMKRAVYDAENIGHWGLAKRFYAHFTSPIRRYPDLTLHRQLAAWLENRPCRIPQTRLAKLARHSTEAEETATEAERNLAEIKKYRVLDAQSRIRNAPAYAAVISRCTPFGCFVELPDIAASGLVHVSRLSHSYVSYDEASGVLRTRNKTWRVGDAISVRPVNVDWRLRRVDFVPVR